MQLKDFPNRFIALIHDSDKKKPIIEKKSLSKKDIPPGYGAFFTVNGFVGERKKSKLTHVNGVFADIDQKQGKVSLQDIQQMTFVDLPPTIINETKNGYHCIWKLTEPIVVTDDNRTEIIETVEGIQRRFVSLYQADNAAVDVGHLLRIPGTEHRKNPTDPFVITTVYEGEDMYTLEELSRVYEPIKKEAPAEVVAGTFTDDMTARLEKMLRSEKVRKLYNGDISEYDDDHSRADSALCCHLAFWFEKDPTVMEKVWLTSPLGRRDKTKQRADYRSQTISRAIAITTEVYKPMVCPQRVAYKKHLQAQDWEDEDWFKKLKELRKNYLLAYHLYVAEVYPHLLYERGEDKTFWNYQDEGTYTQLSFAEVRSMVIALLIEDDMNAEATETNVKNILNRYRAENPDRAASLDDFVATGDWLHVQNGWLNIATLTLEPHTSARRSLHKTAVVYDPKAVCPLYDKFLDVDTQMPADQVRVLDQFSGYVLTPRIDQQKMLILEGRPGCGKSMLPEIWLEMLGKKGTTSSLQSLNSNEIRFMGDVFAHKQLCFFDEANPKTQNINEYFQNMVTKPYITVERKGIQEKVDVRNTLKMVLSLNEMPDHMPPGMERRYRHIMFTRSFTDEDIADPEYKNKIVKHELSGVLNRMLRGLQDLNKMGGLTVIDGESDRKRNYSLSSDDFSAFLEEHFEPSNDGVTRYTFQQMRDAFVAEYPKAYHKQLSIRGFNKKILANRLPEFKYITTAKSGGERGYRGLKLKDGHNFSTFSEQRILVAGEVDF